MPFDPTKPRSRDEVLLQAIVSGDSTPIGDPRDREEEFVKAIADMATVPNYSEASEGDVLQIGTDGPEWGKPTGITKLYEHHVTLSTVSGGTNIYVSMLVFSTSSVQANTRDKFIALIQTESGQVSCSGFYRSGASGESRIIYGMNASNLGGGMFRFTTSVVDFTNGIIKDPTELALNATYIINFGDTVIERE